MKHTTEQMAVTDGQTELAHREYETIRNSFLPSGAGYNEARPDSSQIN